MDTFRIGDCVARKSYGGDINFRISDIAIGRNGRRIYILKGLLYRIMADSDEYDLQRRDQADVQRTPGQAPAGWYPPCFQYPKAAR